MPLYSMSGVHFTFFIVEAVCIKLDSIPVQVSFQTSDGSHFCGGSIYNEYFVITAAHCCVGESASSVLVLAGAHNLYEFEGTEQVVKVEAITRHPDYSSITLENDICILKLAYPLKLNKYVLISFHLQRLLGEELQVQLNNIYWHLYFLSEMAPMTLLSLVLVLVSIILCISMAYELVPSSLFC